MRPDDRRNARPGRGTNDAPACRRLRQRRGKSIRRDRRSVRRPVCDECGTDGCRRRGPVAGVVEGDIQSTTSCRCPVDARRLIHASSGRAMDSRLSPARHRWSRFRSMFRSCSKMNPARRSRQSPCFACDRRFRPERANGRRRSTRSTRHCAHGPAPHTHPATGRFPHGSSSSHHRRHPAPAASPGPPLRPFRPAGRNRAEMSASLPP